MNFIDWLFIFSGWGLGFRGFATNRAWNND